MFKFYNFNVSQYGYTRLSFFNNVVLFNKNLTNTNFIISMV